MTIRVGDRVQWHGMQGTVFQLNGDEYAVVRWDNGMSTTPPVEYLTLVPVSPRMRAVERMRRIIRECIGQGVPDDSPAARAVMQALREPVVGELVTFQVEWRGEMQDSVWRITGIDDNGDILVRHHGGLMYCDEYVRLTDSTQRVGVLL